MSALVIYGLGDFAKMMRHYFAEDTRHEVVAFCADRQFIKEEFFDGLPVIAFEDIQGMFASNDYLMFVAVGYTKMRARKIMFEKARAKNYRFVNYISSHAAVDKTVVFGVNNVVLQGTQIEPFCTIGNNNIIWSSVNVSHDVVVEDHCFIASQSLVGGRASVGEGSFLGFNCTILQNVSLAEETFVGAKSLVLGNTAPFSKNIGIPSKCTEFHFQDGIVIK